MYIILSKFANIRYPLSLIYKTSSLEMRGPTNTLRPLNLKPCHCHLLNIDIYCTSWLPRHWQLLQTIPETPNFDKSQKVRLVVCIELREDFISWFDNRTFWVLVILSSVSQIKLKTFSTKTQLFFLSNPDMNSSRNPISSMHSTCLTF